MNGPEGLYLIAFNARKCCCTVSCSFRNSFPVPSLSGAASWHGHDESALAWHSGLWDIDLLPHKLSPVRDRPSMVPLADPPLNACCKYTSFSESDKPTRLCTDTLNCSQKCLQLRIFPFNTGTSNLGSQFGGGWCGYGTWHRWVCQLLDL